MRSHRAPAAPYAISYHFPIDLASRSLYRLRFANFIEEIAQMSIGNEYWMSCDVLKLFGVD